MTCSRPAAIAKPPVFDRARAAVAYSGTARQLVQEKDRLRDFEKEASHSHFLRLREVSLALYREASQYAATRGIIIADTKFEFGLDDEGRLYLMDEVLTPDSSRFWPAAEYAEGTSPPSFDKQFVRDWLETQDWDKTPPAPRLPTDVLEKTAAKYREALTRLIS